jgi:hypothetical protein
MERDAWKLSARVYAKNAIFRLSTAVSHVWDRAAKIYRHDYTIREAFVLFAIAVCIGAAAKVLASDTIMIGYQDYTLKPPEKIIDIGALKKQMIREGTSMSVSGQQTGGSCNQ